jgi:bifunctional DNA-binding transcriptional regulator/antitoxin component of YhaV-PrlF toxin-antitoxin module
MTVTLDDKPIVVPDAVRRNAGLRRGNKVEFRFSGREIPIVPKSSSEEDYPMEKIMRIIQEEQENPMLGIKERDLSRIIHESRVCLRGSS